jgi:predicted nucleic acid-binding Zn ribbon protein
MKACFYCGRAIQDNARVCRHCGRDLRDNAARGRGVTPKKTLQIALLAVGAAASLVLVAVLILVFRYRSTPTSRPTVAMTTPEPSPTASASSARWNKRLFLENNLNDADDRARALKTIVGDAGERCDSIERSAMRSPGNWIITCRSGHIYTFLFDKQGELKEVKKMN